MLLSGLEPDMIMNGEVRRDRNIKGPLAMQSVLPPARKYTLHCTVQLRLWSASH